MLYRIVSRKQYNVSKGNGEYRQIHVTEVSHRDAGSVGEIVSYSSHNLGVILSVELVEIPADAPEKPLPPSAASDTV